MDKELELKVSKQPSQLSTAERKTNAIRAGMKLVPYIGSTLEKLIFGKLDELRWKRLEHTLTELANQMKRSGVEASTIDSEQFANLLEVVAPTIGKTTNEDKRKIFRDFLFNAAYIPKNELDWEEANLAAQLLNQIEAPAIIILATIHQAFTSFSVQYRHLSKNNQFRFYSGKDPYKPPSKLEIITPERDYQVSEYLIHYPWAIIEGSVKTLTDLGLIVEQEYGNVCLTSLGELLCNWILTEDSDKTK